LAGEVDRAEERFQAAMGYANDLGLMSEEGDVSSGAFLGNFPQAFSHVGLINAAWRLTEAARPQTHAPLSTKETS
jgi:GH15 family glucan-1,4-alpha-glucosidase